VPLRRKSEEHAYAYEKQLARTILDSDYFGFTTKLLRHFKAIPTCKAKFVSQSTSLKFRELKTTFTFKTTSLFLSRFVQWNSQMSIFTKIFSELLSKNSRHYRLMKHSSLLVSSTHIMN